MVDLAFTILSAIMEFWRIIRFCSSWRRTASAFDLWPTTDDGGRWSGNFSRYTAKTLSALWVFVSLASENKLVVCRFRAVLVTPEVFFGVTPSSVRVVAERFLAVFAPEVFFVCLFLESLLCFGMVSFGMIVLYSICGVCKCMFTAIKLGIVERLCVNYNYEK